MMLIPSVLKHYIAYCKTLRHVNSVVDLILIGLTQLCNVTVIM